MVNVRQMSSIMTKCEKGGSADVGHDVRSIEQPDELKAVQIECMVGILILVADIDLGDIELETPPTRSHLSDSCSTSQTNYIDYVQSTVGNDCYKINIPVGSAAIMPLFEVGPLFIVFSWRASCIWLASWFVYLTNFKCSTLYYSR